MSGKTHRAETEGNQRPAISREDYERGREVLDALPAGVYLKCSGCKRWQRGGTIAFRGVDVMCERCDQ